MLSYYMGKNTPERQQFIVEHLRVEKDTVSDDQLLAEPAKVVMEAGE